MADKKITALTELNATAKAGEDFLHIIDYGGGSSPVNKKISLTNLFNNVNLDTHIYGASKTFEVGFGAAQNAHLTVTTGSGASADGTVTVNDDGVDFVDFLVKSGESNGAIKVDSGTDDVSVNSDGNAAVDFHVHGGTKELITTDGGEDWVGIGTATPVTAYTLSVGATSGKAIEAQGTIDITGALTVSTTSTLTGNTTVGSATAGVLALSSVEAVTYASGTSNKPSNSKTTTLLTVSTGASSGGLDDGTIIGQIKIIHCVARSAGAYTMTPENLNGYSSIAFDAKDESVILMWQSGGWVIINQHGVTLA